MVSHIKNELPFSQKREALYFYCRLLAKVVAGQACEVSDTGWPDSPLKIRVLAGYPPPLRFGDASRQTRPTLTFGKDSAR